MSSVNFIVFDLETGGFSEHKNPICEIAMIAIDGETLKERGRYEAIIAPYNDTLIYEPSALKVNGLTMKKIEGGRQAKDVIKDITDFAKEHKSGSKKPVLVGHNIGNSFINPNKLRKKNIRGAIEGGDATKASKIMADSMKTEGFDIKFLSKFLMEFNKDILSSFEARNVDTLWMAKNIWFNASEMANFKLGTCCEAIGVRLSNAHSAMPDTEANAKLFVHFMKKARGEDNNQITSKQDKKERVKLNI